MSNIKYKPEIDGLRAVAVMPVIFFHAGFSGFSGGFVGVDVFFVISGYLITSIIVKDIEAGAFSYREFYERRARRILPALYLVIVCCIPFAWLWMMPLELKAFSTSVVSVCLFVSNLLFWRQSGYFDEAAELKPLLHTWSLAIEEQFYIIFPVALLLLLTINRRSQILSIALVALISLILSEYASRYFPYFNFYWLPTRAWELMAGALSSFAIIKPSLLRDNVLSAAGVVAILISIFTYNETIPFPSLYAALPVIGTCLVLLFARQGTVASRLFSLPPLVGIGVISYSIYLWHQPLFAFARIRSLSEPPKLFMLGLCFIAVGLAYVSWRFVEMPFRRRRANAIEKSWFSLSTITASVGIIVAFGLFGHFSKGAPSRLSASQLAILKGVDDIGEYRNDCLNAPSLTNGYKNCQLGVHSGTINFILFGDSFAAAIADGVSAAAENANKSGLFFGLHSCPPIIGVGGWWPKTKSRCKPFQQSMLSIVDEVRPKNVILFAEWSALDDNMFVSEYAPEAKRGVEAFEEPLIHTVAEFRKRGAAVYIIYCTPHAKDNVYIPQALAKISLFHSDAEIRQNMSEYKQENASAFELFYSDRVRNHAKIIDLTQDFCGEGLCNLVREDKPLFFDRGHLSKFGSLSLRPTLQSIFAEEAP